MDSTYCCEVALCLRQHQLKAVCVFTFELPWFRVSGSWPIHLDAVGSNMLQLHFSVPFVLGRAGKMQFKQEVTRQTKFSNRGAVQGESVCASSSSTPSKSAMSHTIPHQLPGSRQGEARSNLNGLLNS